MGLLKSHFIYEVLNITSVTSFRVRLPKLQCFIFVIKKKSLKHAQAKNLEIVNIRTLLFFFTYFIIQIIKITLYTGSFHGC